MRRLGLVLILLAGCGGEEATMHIGFRQQGLMCRILDLQAKLQISGVSGFCPLRVGLDDTVSGTCPAVPATEHTFRLVYYKMYPSPMTDMPVEVDLAVAVKCLDLTGVKAKAIVLDFGDAQLDTSFDCDNDGLSNIAQACMGMNPLVPGS